MFATWGLVCVGGGGEWEWGKVSHLCSTSVAQEANVHIFMYKDLA